MQNLSGKGLKWMFSFQNTLSLFIFKVLFNLYSQYYLHMQGKECGNLFKKHRHFQAKMFTIMTQ